MAPFTQDVRWAKRQTASVCFTCTAGRRWGLPAHGPQDGLEAQRAEGGPSVNTRRFLTPAPIVFLPRIPASPSGAPQTEPGT